jgi:hypothetical protein
MPARFRCFQRIPEEYKQIDTSDFGCPGIQCLKADIGKDVEFTEEFY